MTDRSGHHNFSDEAHWTAVADGYERWVEPSTAQFARAALSLSGGVERGERVLDVAAGTGALTLAAAEAGARVLATDISRGMVARLRERLQPFAGCEARVMDGQALEVEDASFDASFSVFGVMMFPDWRRGMAELVRAIRPGGRVIVAAWANPEGAGPMPLFLEVYRRVFPEATILPSPPGMSVLCSREGLRAEMVRAGCGEVAVHAVGGVWTWPSVEHVMRDIDEILRLAPHFSALDDDGRARLNGPLRAAIEPCAEPGGAVRVPTTANIAIGRKTG
ncbi:ubiquinone biosynthesis protein UbiE [Sorangium cellulosum]|uniref:Ubiquinone biosynthesis protein UbiE n=1 Tax=Sorangium cellulosum TaxID=56 RepID=A0A4P2PYH8_SORCE|nr:methyltransferase domain-containing protein [Sorangium cellulosum]AUX21850.1 ubiquinone biosynthesis protein UbiE [Sorangium cellulosum]